MDMDEAAYPQFGGSIFSSRYTASFHLMEQPMLGI